MPRIVGVDIPDKKKLPFALAYIRGIGIETGKQIVETLGLDPMKRAYELTEDEVSAIATHIDKTYRVEGELRRELRENIRRLVDTGTYRGKRHKNNLPSRGQKTKSNARTAKGPRKTMGGVSVRKAVSKT
ncbi:30S ribosomal protein S13 [bacterium]|uniref:Small ribosomal subunit protein uS13 n=2 Tax=Katanobacteria TaxID=422282 RepID=A0A2M7X031_UNCKA|nr:30S ribosomal protein S13 [bacterium]PIP56643.1 MAG: 30S ribosomal protein S13 [candidate division WWE3 bacterium CG22_combo_CG10-13_8_21_14_all_39_12]PJA39359.1 MAG: 30S ribosomal protein S13 [candidate division WWE3 bacterium CG_4_9_14_3_um_filter_39_7]